LLPPFVKCPAFSANADDARAADCLDLRAFRAGLWQFRGIVAACAKVPRLPLGGYRPARIYAIFALRHQQCRGLA
jgi:hypothetical protein